MIIRIESHTQAHTYKYTCTYMCVKWEKLRTILSLFYSRCRCVFYLFGQNQCSSGSFVFVSICLPADFLKQPTNFKHKLTRKTSVWKGGSCGSEGISSRPSPFSTSRTDSHMLSLKDKSVAEECTRSRREWSAGKDMEALGPAVWECGVTKYRSHLP